MSALTPLAKGFGGGLIGYAVGGGIFVAIRAGAGASSPWDLATVLAGGWLFGLVGWLLGVGVWAHWARPWFGKSLRPYERTGWRRYFAFDTDHKVIGVQYLITFLGMFFLAGLLAVLMRTELMSSGRDVMSPATYNSVMSLHGTVMIFVAIATIIGAFGNYVVPLMIGAEDMAFPKLNALSYWMIPPVFIFLFASFFAGGYDSGWTAYPPLSVTNEPGQVLFGLAFITIGLSSIIGGVNFITTIVKMRAPGMGWGRVPIFVWSILLTAILAYIFSQFVAVAMIMIILERVAGTVFFTADGGGQPILYQHIFWFYSHPAVYVMILPAWGVILEVISHCSRKPLFAYKWAVGGLIGVTSMSAIVWAHHMFTAVPEPLKEPFLLTTELISIPTGLVFLSALGTLWQGRLRMTVPMLFSVGVLFNFLIGGLTGVFLADVPADVQLHDTYFVVAHFHYVIVGGGIFGLFAAIYYWFPKMTGRMYSQRLGKLHFWLAIVGFNLTFLPMFMAGLQGMNRRIADYLPYLEPVNRWVSLAGFFFGASFLVFIWNYIRSWRKGETAPANPWNAHTLEWQTSSPPPLHNFTEPPVVVGDPYCYGEDDAEHAVIGERVKP